MAEKQLKERGPEAAKTHHQEEMDFLRIFSDHLTDRLRKLALRKGTASAAFVETVERRFGKGTSRRSRRHRPWLEERLGSGRHAG
jgi:hypothetical protein